MVVSVRRVSDECKRTDVSIRRDDHPPYNDLNVIPIQPDHDYTESGFCYPAALGWTQMLSSMYGPDKK